MALLRLRGYRLLGQVSNCRVMMTSRYNEAVNQESFLNSTSSTYLEDMYNLWRKDPKSVHASWDTYFRRVTQGMGPANAYQSPPTITPLPMTQRQGQQPSRQPGSRVDRGAQVLTGEHTITEQLLTDHLAMLCFPQGQQPSRQPGLRVDRGAQGQQPSRQPGSRADRGAQVLTSEHTITEQLLTDHLAMQNVIRAYQTRGHLVASVDPLGLKYGELHSSFEDRKGVPPKRVVRDYMLKNSPEAMDTVYKLPSTTYIGGPDKALSLRVILQRLERIYCHHIGVEYTYISSFTKSQWLAQKFETPGVMEMSNDEKRLIVKRLVRSVNFEAFLAKKYTSEKRFGLEGCDVLVPALKKIIDTASTQGTSKIIIGMPHRGRLNVIVNVLRQPLYKLFTHFSGLESAEEDTMGDVKYHLGMSVKRVNRVTNKEIEVQVVANPSHLEVVSPVVMGKVRAEQFFQGDKTGKKVLGIIMHGDAAFCGQGVVFESFHLSHLPEYTPRGIIHIVVNNQIGFTTDPRYSRSSAYCTDVGRVTQAPIFHVNSDDPEAVIHVCKVAVEYRNLFQRDVVIDIVCYRRNGHNEGDEPSFTQPLMYKKIRSMPNILEKYSKQLIEMGVVTAEEIEKERSTYSKILDDEFARAKKETHIKWKDWIDTPWKNFFKGKNMLERKATGVDDATLKHIGGLFASPPPKELEITHHAGLNRIFKLRTEMVKARQADWAIGEALAWGSLLKEKYHVRVSGQDVERGTFGHRHHVIHDQNVDKKFYIPLKHLYLEQGEYTICNSSISECGVLGYEIGFSTTSPKALVMWESQFGDFANGGQVMIDQFLCSGEAKWIRQCGLVMLNPHGMEGMGPEHSSARPERFLQMCNDDPDQLPNVDDPDFYMRQLREINWIVANCSTPANFFHIIRRQMLMPFRKPLILFTPKSLLRHPRCKSSFDDMVTGTEFQRIIPDMGPANKNPKGVKKHIFCTGKVYYDVVEAREKAKLEEVIAITRLEQLCPFPFDVLKTEVAKYPNSELCWAQEEHKNMGAWHYIIPRFATGLRECEKDVMTYIGRVSSASPATGSKAVFKAEMTELLAQAMNITNHATKHH